MFRNGIKTRKQLTRYGNLIVNNHVLPLFAFEKTHAKPSLLFLARPDEQTPEQLRLRRH
jgi:hypothetical protein